MSDPAAKTTPNCRAILRPRPPEIGIVTEKGQGAGVDAPPSVMKRQAPSARRAQRSRYFPKARSTLPSGLVNESTYLPTLNPRSPLSLEPANIGVQSRTSAGVQPAYQSITSC